MSESEEIANLKADITRLRKHLVMHHQAADSPLLKGYAPYNGLDKPTTDDFDAVLDDLRRKGASIDGDNAYKRDLCDSIVGAMAFGVQNRNPPPAGHWGQRFWDIGREERALSEELIEALKDLADDIAERFDLDSPSTNPGIKIYVERARAVIAKATQ
ncbi:hypothetical protein [Pseudomonas sp. GM67]|uniref:hypothetical protein n=1 Tax=Pseudomonas sp. GM67 TaxID=1144335 RepID=UPI000270C38B|nr:hypothetical protein [Pseudomonas sp. GM67]EJM92473.1 hypothetical protein PMI33_00730 [Pseudomonas sp. GM67]